MVRSSDSGGVEEINGLGSGSDKCDMDLNGNGNIINCDKKTEKLNIDLNEVDNEHNELDLNDTASMLVDGEVLSVQNVEGVVFDGDKEKNKIDLVSNEDTKECEEANVETIFVTCGQKRRPGRVSNKEMEAVSTIKGEFDSNAELNIDTTVLKRNTTRTSKERKVESNIEEKVGFSSDDNDANICTGAQRIGFGELRKKGKAMITYCKKVDADTDIDTTVPKKKRGRPPKKSEVESNAGEEIVVNACDDADTETFVGSSERRVSFAKMPNKKGKATFNSNKKVDVDADVETIVPKKKRGRPRKERSVGSSVEEKVQVCGGVDNACDEEKDEEDVVEMSTSLLEREMEGRRNKYDNSEHMENGEDAAVSAHVDKSEKGRRGRKRKMLETSVDELDNSTYKTKPETQFDGNNEVVGRVLRSRAVPLTDDERKEKYDFSSDKTNEKIKEESAHLSDRKDKKLKGPQGSPPKVPEKSELLKVNDDEQEESKGSKSADVAEQEETSTLDGKSKKNSTQKQLVTERIKSMLITAGWKIDLRPRRGKENVLDKVYVNPKGRGYWSVTLAYKILKEEVENGEATNMEREAYFPIAEDDWNSLLRVNTKKSKKSKEEKDQSSKAISRTKNLEKKQVKEKVRLRLKQKAAVKNSSEKEKKNKKRFTLLARGSKKGSDSEGEDFLLYEGQRSLLSWMIDLGTLPLGAKVKCFDSKRTKVLREGQVTKDGIQCDCCTEILSLADFECHTGSSLGLPFLSIYLDSRTLLLRCLRDSWGKYAESEKLGFHSVLVDDDDPNDDTCNMCGDGGNLICCDSCPSAIHQKCLNIEQFPSGDWNCVYCCCKFCGTVGESEADEDHNCDQSVPALPTCRLCEEKYHPLCAQGKATSHKEPNSSAFCGQKCQEILNQLEVILGVKHQMGEGFSWTLIQHSNDDLDISSLSGARNVESNAKLAVAWSIMDECFLPIVDQRSGINMLRNVVFSCGSNIRRLDYSGFFIVILERGDEIISAASIRIHGNLLAEMPFIGTRHTYRRQGMCRRLLTAIETALSSLNVENLVLPAIPELKQTWTSVFGFMPVENSLKNEMKCMNIIAFPGIAMLQKPVTKQLTGSISRTTADVVTIDNPASQVTNVSSKGPSVINDSKDSKEDVIAPPEDVSQLNYTHRLDESDEQKDVPADVEGRTAVSVTVSDPVNLEMKTTQALVQVI